MNLPTSMRSGDLVDRYRLGDLVATGGMASVFRATDTGTGRRVVLKIPHAAKLNDPLALDRLRHEIEIGAKLDHVGLIKILRANGAGDRFVVMEWFDGRPLRKIISEKGPLSRGRAVRIALGICNALEYVHGRGIVHGDLKPENVMIDLADNIKLMDFGIARETRMRLWGRPRHEEAGGTPDYASPEQIQGKRSDARSDIYSLGIMLFEMLTGHVPFSGLDPAIAMNLRTFADAPHVSELNPDISPRLEAVVQRSLARGRVQRYASAQELACSLSELLAEELKGQPLKSFANV
jgi:eukaryotic-like serine/threonine-protein kinase